MHSPMENFSRVMKRRKRIKQNSRKLNRYRQKKESVSLRIYQYKLSEIDHREKKEWEKRNISERSRTMANNLNTYILGFQNKR